MKKTISLFLSIIMLLSITAGIDLSAYANEPDTAPTLSLNGAYVEGELTKSEHAKYYKFTIPSDGTVTLRMMTYCYQTELYLYNEDVEEIDLVSVVSGTSSQPESNNNHGNTYDLSKGTYYIKVDTFYSISEAFGRYKVKVDFESFNTNEKEPNDYDCPMTLNKNATITGALTEQDDVDWYKITISRKSNVNINLNHYLGTVRIGLYNPDLSVEYFDTASYSSNVKPKTENYKEVLTPGTYYIKVYQQGWYTGKYTIKWTATCSTHSYKNTVTPATTKANGKIVKKCSVCGASTTTTIYKASSIKLSTTSYKYNGKAKKPTVTVKDSKGNKISSSYYTVKYSSNKNVGKATATITFKGNYKGTVTKTFTIKPASTSIKKVTSKKKKSFTVSWNKLTTQTTGYEIQYSTNSNFKSAKTVTVSKNKTTSKTVSKLKAKKKYYVRVRTYKTVKVNGKSTKIYSAWSKAKTVTTKK